MKKKIGSRPIAGLLGIVLVFAPFSSGQDQAGSSYAIVAGTVFRDPGYAQPGATVTLTPRGNPKAKKMQAVTTARGEFSFRVATEPATYVVKASLKGFRSDEKEAPVAGGERVEVSLTLTPDSK